MRNYLGELKTPFNKHDLIRALSRMLLKKENKEKALNLLDDDDIRLLSLISLLEKPNIESLYEFTKDFYTFLELHNRITNLQERLLIFIEEKKIIEISPVFYNELIAGYLDSTTMFPSLQAAGSSSSAAAGEPWLKEQLICAYLSFIQNDPGGKKSLALFESIFTGVRQLKTDELIANLNKIAAHLNLTAVNRGAAAVNLPGVLQFTEREAETRTTLMAGAAISCFQPAAKANPAACAVFFRSLLQTFPHGITIDKKDFHNSCLLLISKIRNQNHDSFSIDTEAAEEALLYFGFLKSDGDKLLMRHPPVPDELDKIRLQSNSEIAAPANLAFDKEALTALCSRIKNCDITRTYEIDKASFLKALKTGLNTDDIIHYFRKKSTGGLPQNILFSLNAWTKEYSSIQLKYGVVMTVSKDRLPLIKHTPELQQYLTNQPAPGVFILDPDTEARWRPAFINAGFDMLPAVEKNYNPPAPAVQKQTLPQTVNGVKLELYSRDRTTEPEKIINHLTEKINGLRFSNAEKKKLEARARKKLILSESQLTVSNKPEEIGEAGGLDHQAKIRLANRALELDNLLEITIVNDFDLEQKLIKPFKINKTNVNVPNKPPLYTIEAIELPDENNFNISITKISYMKMLKSSLFTP